jgi:hypothetical protein
MFFKDNKGGYWFTTLENGIYYVPFTAIEGFTVENGLVDNNVINLTSLNNELFIGFKGYNSQTIKENLTKKISLTNTAQ